MSAPDNHDQQDQQANQDAPPTQPVDDELALRVLRALDNLHRHLHGMQHSLADLRELLGVAAPPASSRAPRASTSAQLAPPPDSRLLARKLRGEDLVFTSGAALQQELELVPNGINGVTGAPLLKIDALEASRMARRRSEDDSERGLHRLRDEQTRQQHLGLVFGISPDRLDESRWAIVIHANEDARLLEALFPLIRHRSAQQQITLPPLDVQPGETCKAWLDRLVPNAAVPWAERPPVLLYYSGESSSNWLRRHGVSHGPVDPRRGVPYYLLLVGHPGATRTTVPPHIPFLFQYELDLFWGVGRICFTDEQGNHRLQDYRTYAEQVVAFEQRDDPGYGRQFVLFGTRHDFDTATQRSANELVLPLAQGDGEYPSVAARSGFGQQLYLAAGEQGQPATRANLQAILRGQTPNGRPALLFTATHGLGFPFDDPVLVERQGALLCQDWPGVGTMQREHYFAATDLDTATDVQGLIVCCFACYGAGCPEQDEFVFAVGEEQVERPFIAPFPLISHLAQQLLLRGALAFIGHIDRAWTYSFSAPGVPAQVQGFEDLLARLMAGKRAGFAMDQFNQRQGALALLLSNELENISFGKQVQPPELSKLWIARNDARNYALLGDPAVRLPLEQMPAQA